MNQIKKILIVEDDHDIAMLEKDYLEVEGFRVEILPNGDGVLSRVKTGEFALVLLDVMLPKRNGYDLCRDIRKVSDIPIILVTARGETVDIVRGLSLGSDDYITKPFDPAVMVARVKAGIESYNRHKNLSTRIYVGNLVIDPQSCQVFKNGEEIALPRKEFDLLCFLAENRNQVFSKEDLFEHVWGLESLADTATVTVHINRLREKIEDDPDNPTYIRTVWGVGYCIKSN